MIIGVGVSKDVLAAKTKADIIDMIIDGTKEIEAAMKKGKMPEVEKVEFNNRATIIFFNDGTKTVSKCNQCGYGYGKPPCVLGVRDPQENETCKTMGYSKEMGVMVAIAKRACPSLRKKLQGWCQ